MFSVCVGLVLTMLAMFAAFTTKYYQLKADTSSAQSFTLLKNFFAYVDDLEYNVFTRHVEKTDFKETVEKITGLKISDKESEYLLKMVDVNRNGIGEDGGPEASCIEYYSALEMLISASSHLEIILTSGKYLMFQQRRPALEATGR